MIKKLDLLYNLLHLKEHTEKGLQKEGTTSKMSLTHGHTQDALQAEADAFGCIDWRLASFDAFSQDTNFFQSLLSTAC